MLSRYDSADVSKVGESVTESRLGESIVFTNPPTGPIFIAFWTGHGTSRLYVDPNTGPPPHRPGSLWESHKQRYNDARNRLKAVAPESEVRNIILHLGNPLRFAPVTPDLDGEVNPTGFPDLPDLTIDHSTAFDFPTLQLLNSLVLQGRTALAPPFAAFFFRPDGSFLPGPFPDEHEEFRVAWGFGGRSRVLYDEEFVKGLDERDPKWPFLTPGTVGQDDRFRVNAFGPLHLDNFAFSMDLFARFWEREINP